jgi:outer membrane protein assembly factor BamB
MLVCLDRTTGNRVWKGGKYGYGQILLVADLLLIQAESGDIVLVEATPDGHRELARLPALAGKTWNNPVLAGDLLLVRNDREAACYRVALAAGGLVGPVATPSHQ